MTDYVHFDGDPATDSARRHMERVLKGWPTPPRWFWVAAPLAGLAAWYFWPWRGPNGHGAAEAAAAEPARERPAQD
jgi:hypothetical protein